MLIDTNQNDNQFAYAGFWMRAIALVIDLIVLSLITLPVSVVFPDGTDFSQSTASPDDNILATILYIVIMWIYASTLESSKWQATLGKKALGLRVVDSNGNRVSFARATGRHFAKIISTALLFIGYFMAGWTKQKRALHDMIANTLVIKE